MSFIDSSYFIGSVTVAQLGQSSVVTDLEQIIKEHEESFLSDVLGYELYDAMIEGLDTATPDQKWLDLRDGAKFVTTTNFPGYFPFWTRTNWFLNSVRRTRWVGFQTTDFLSPLTAYCYYRYMEHLRTQPTGVGIVKATAGASAGGVDQGKMVKAWNQMSKDIVSLWLFLAAKGTEVYAEYDTTKIAFFKYEPINPFGL